MNEITLTMVERKELERISRAQAVDAAQSRRARLILLLADKAKWMVIRDKLDCDTRFISRWRGRFISERLAGLFSRHTGRASYKVDESDWKLRFLPGPVGESPPMDRPMGPVASWPVNSVESRT